MSTDSNMAASPLLVLGKISEILETFTLQRRALTLSEIQRATGMPRSTVQRLVSNMVSQGFLDKSGDQVLVGTKMRVWAAAATRDLDFLTIAKSILEEMRDLTGETVSYLRPEQSFCVAVAVAETRHSLRHEMHVGKVIPLDDCLAGRVFLAYAPHSASKVLGGQMQMVTDELNTTSEAECRTTSKIRAGGYATTVGGCSSDVSALSAPIFDSAADVIGVLTISGPTYRMPQERCEEWGELLVSRADRMIRSLGGRYPDGTP